MKSEFDITIRKAMLDLGFSWDMLAEEIEYNTGSNLITAIRTRKLRDDFLVKLCKVLKLDLGEIFKLKVL